MAKPTIKGLQDEIADLKVCIQSGLDHEKWQKDEINGLKDTLKHAIAQRDVLERDKRWLQSLIQNLSVPSAERTRF